MSRTGLLLLLAFNCVALDLCQPQPRLAVQSSRWNILYEGGKGECWGKPVCHSLGYFSGSPFLFDWEQDLISLKPADLHAATSRTALGTLAGHQVFQIIQTITYTGGDLTMKRIVVQRQDNEYCAIYQQQYAAELVKVTPVTVIYLHGRPVLKTFDQNGEHTWNEEYWAFDQNGPLLLDKDPLRRQLNTLFHGDDEAWPYYLDLKGSTYEDSVYQNGSLAGFLAVNLAVADHRIIVLSKRWTPCSHALPQPKRAACYPLEP